MSRKHDEIRRITKNLYRGFDVDYSGTVWISTRSDVVRYRGDRLETVSLGRRLSSINTIASDRRGGLWIHDIDQGLLHFRDTKLEASPLPATFEGARVEIQTVPE